MLIYKMWHYVIINTEKKIINTEIRIKKNTYKNEDKKKILLKNIIKH